MAGSSSTTPEGNRQCSLTRINLHDLPLGPAKLVSEFLPLEEPVTCEEVVSLLTLYPLPFLRFVIRDDYDTHTAAELEEALLSVTLPRIHELTVNISTVDAVGPVRFLLRCEAVDTLFLCLRGPPVPILKALVPDFLQSRNRFHGIYACPSNLCVDPRRIQPFILHEDFQLVHALVDIVSGDHKVKYFDVGMHYAAWPQVRLLQELPLFKRLNMCNLIYLTLRGGENIVADVTELLRDTEDLQLRFLCIETTSFMNRTAKAVSSLLRDSQCRLEVLELAHLSGDIEDFVIVFDALLLNLRVNELSLSSLDLYCKGAKALRRLLELSTTLRKVRLASVAFGFDGVDHVMRGLEKTRSVKYLGLQGPIVEEFTGFSGTNGAAAKLAEWKAFKAALKSSGRFMAYKPFDFEHFTYRRSYYYYETERESRRLSRAGCTSLGGLFN